MSKREISNGVKLLVTPRLRSGQAGLDNSKKL